MLSFHVLDMIFLLLENYYECFDSKVAILFVKRYKFAQICLLKFLVTLPVKI